LAQRQNCRDGFHHGLVLIGTLIKVEKLKEQVATVDWAQHPTVYYKKTKIKNIEGDKSLNIEEEKEEEKKELVIEEDAKEEQERTPVAVFSNATTTQIRISSPLLERQYIIMGRPTENNTVIAFIAMGPHRTFLVHRAIRSIRASGEFHGYIMIMTDRSGWDYFSWSLDQPDNKVILIQGHDQHLMATHAAPSSSSTVGSNNSNHTNPTTTQGRPFKPASMVYKRFKTHLLEYITEHDVLNREMEYCLYLDIDNVIFHPIQHLLNEYYNEFATTYQQIIEKDANRLMTQYHHRDNANNTLSTTPSNVTTTTTDPIIKFGHQKPRLQFVSMWKDIRPEAKLWQSGQIFYHRRYSQGCMDRWRAEIDSDDNYGEFMEQPLLVKALQHQYQDLFRTVPPLSPHQSNIHHQDINQDSGNSRKVLCHVVELPDQLRHFNMARTDIVSGPIRNIPTILHYSHARVVQNAAQEQRNSFVQALQLRYQSIPGNGTVNATVAVSKEDGSQHLVSRNNTLFPWETIITPMSTYGKAKSDR
jgi:hypothetical protein